MVNYEVRVRSPAGIDGSEATRAFEIKFLKISM